MRPSSVGQRDNFIASVGKHVPWRIMSWLLESRPALYQLLQYGTRNINTREHWDDAWRRHGRDGFRATSDALLLRECVQKAVPLGSKVLDVGCGVGETMESLRDLNACECFGVDIAPSAVAIVNAKGMRAEVTTLPSIPYPDGFFEIVVCTETLEHVSDARGTLREIHRVLRSNGTLVLSVPDGCRDREDSHVHRFRPSDLRKLLVGVFEIERTDLLSNQVVNSLLVIARRSPAAASVRW